MKIHELPDTLLAQGRHTASTEELLELTGLDRTGWTPHHRSREVL
jgi:hypothetical protein